MSHHGIAEILSSGQFPGVSVRQPVRSAVMRDKAGRTTRTLYAGQEDLSSVDRDMVRLAEQDGLDLRSARMDVVEEHGQGVGKRQDLKSSQALRKRRPQRERIAREQAR